MGALLDDAYRAWKKAMKDRKNAKNKGDEAKGDVAIDKAFKDLIKKYIPYQRGKGDSDDDKALDEIDHS